MGNPGNYEVLAAGEVGASHRRERVFIVGVAHGHRRRLQQFRRGGLLDGVGPAQRDDVDGCDLEDVAHGSQFGRGQGRPESSRVEGRLDVAERDRAMAHPARHGGDGSAEPVLEYAASVRLARHNADDSTGHEPGGAPEPLPGGPELVHAASTRRQEREPNQNGFHDIGFGREQLADTSNPRPQGHEQRGTRDSNRGGAGSTWTSYRIS